MLRVRHQGRAGLLFAFAMAAFALLTSAVLSGCGESASSASATGSLNGSNVEFSLTSLNQGPQFFTYETSSGKVGIMAVRDADGNVRAALDTCQVCNGSPKAYFLEKDGQLQCQNCGNLFNYSIVGESQLGCEPTPLPSGSWTVSGDVLKVDESALASCAGLFTTWAKA